MKSIKPKLLLISILILIIFLLIFVESFNHSYSDEPEFVDVIVVLTGASDKGRMMKAAELYHDGYAEKVLITPVLEYSTLESLQVALDLGIKEDDILTDYEATSTYSNALETINIMQNNEMNSALIVTNDYHIKRSKLIYERIRPDDISFFYVAAYSEENEKWYEREYARYYWFREFYKYWGYTFGLYKFTDQ